MLTLAVGLFVVAALAGLTMLIQHFQGKTPPKVGLALVHGLFAASGLVVLLVAAMKLGFSGAPALALGLFVLAALGGFTLALGFHLRQRPLPSGLVVGHGLLAVAAFLILLASVLGLA